MNIVITSRLLKKTTLLISLLSASWLLTACGGGGDSSNSPTSSTSSASSHIFSSAPVTPPGSGTWPDVKISASGSKALKFEWSAPPSSTSYYKLLKKMDSTSDYQQVGANFTDTTISDTVSVHLTDWVNSRYKVQACSDSGCIDSTEIVTNSAMLSAITYVKASNTESDDWFGWSIAISADGKTLAVGAPAENSHATGINGDQLSNTSPNSGAVYVFSKVDGNWLQQAYLKASNTEQPNTAPNQTQQINDRFGYQVALSDDGNTLAVSAIMEDSLSIGINCYQDDFEFTTTSLNSSSSSENILTHLQTNRGAVYIFNRADNAWAQQTYIKSFNTEIDLRFGSVLALSGDGKRLAVGSPNDATTLQGVFMLNKSSTSSNECFNFNASRSSANSSASTISSINSNSSSSTNSNIAVAASSTTSSLIPGGVNSGAVYLYKLTNGQWQEDAYVKAPDAEVNDLFGVSISLSQDGSLLAVGATGEDSKDATAANDSITLFQTAYQLNNGGVYIFALNDVAWTYQTKVKPANHGWNQLFGASVAISGDGNTLAVGTPGDWSKAKGINGNGNDFNTETDALPGGMSPYYGAAYVFSKTNNTWTQQSYFKAATPHMGDQFGSHTAVSFDGSVVAIGALGEGSLARGINGDAVDASSPTSGAAYLFTRLGNNWVQKSYVKAPNSEANDRFGHALGLDASGESFVVGAHRESSNAKGINGTKDDNSASASGAVYIY